MNLNQLTGAAVIGQSGGPTAVINATLAGVIKSSLNQENRGRITTLYGMRNGIEGFLEDRLVNLTELFSNDAGEADAEKLDLLMHTPAAALGSCRKKLPDPNENADFFENMLTLFKARDIRFFFYIGGNDSMDTVDKLSRYVSEHDYPMCVMGLPKTIDNDLPGTDHAPGYGSAAKFIATEMQEIVRDCAVYTVPAVTIVEIMGRDAGWLTASAALPRITGGAAPDLVYLPEKPFSMQSFFNDVRAIMKKNPNVVVAVSEGIRNADGKYVGDSSQSGATDVFGHRYLAGTAKTLEYAVKEEFGCKVRSIELNLPQRCGAHFASLTDVMEAEAAGCAGLEAALYGATGCMIAILRASEADGYSVVYETSDISKIANKERLVPDEFINERGNNVTDACLEYILPLIQGEPVIRMKNGIPVHFVI